jgi:hypothetical protein
LGGAFFTLLYYLPIYFQSIQNVTAEESGIRNLPMIIAMCKSTSQPKIKPANKSALSTVVAGGLLSTFGFFAPLFIVGGIFSTIGCGLIYTLDLASPSSHWIGFQILAGIGFGLCFQAPIMVGQALSKPEDVSTVTAILLCESSLQDRW